MGSPLPPPTHGMPQYYAHPPPNMGAQVPMGSMRYQLPPQQGDHQRVLSGGRHKKEIKRRTKTGCLTCRKRRIKVRMRARRRQWHALCRRDMVANSGVEPSHHEASRSDQTIPTSLIQPHLPTTRALTFTSPVRRSPPLLPQLR